MTEMKLTNVQRRGRATPCSLCAGGFYGRQAQSEAVESVGGHALCERHLALVRAIRDDAEAHGGTAKGRAPTSRLLRRAAV